MSDLSKDNNKKTFVSFKDEFDKVVSGYFELISLTDSLLTIATDKNILTIPVSRVLKIKQDKESEQNGR